MITPLLHITMPEDDGEDRHFAPLVLAVQAMILINKWHMSRQLERTKNGKGVPVPPLYASGVVYKEDPPGEENWKDCLAVLKDGFADCDRLVAYRVAELNVAGIPADPVIKWQQIPREMMIQMGHPPDQVPAEGISMVHVLVRIPNQSCPVHGTWARATDPDKCTCDIEDPSKILGMGGEYTSRV
jgi:hypothetical protein